MSFTDDIALDTTFAIADVNDPSNRDTQYTKTVVIPGNNDIIKELEFIFDINSTLQNFNPNKKIPARYEVDGAKPFEGQLQLVSITENYDGTSKQLMFNCTIIGNNADLFLSLTDKYLTGSAVSSDDLDFSDLNHTLNFTNFSAAPTLGVGYCYGYIDYGLDGLNGIVWRVDHMKAAIFALEYVKRIFAKAGKTFTSTFLNSTYFKSLAIPDVNEGSYQFSKTQIAGNQFYAGKTATQVGAASSTSISGSTYSYVANSIPTIIFQDETTPPFNDPGLNYNTATGVFTVATQTQNIVTFILKYTLKISAIPTATIFNVIATSVVVCIYRNGTIVSQQTANIGSISIAIVGGFATISTSTSITYTAASSDPAGTTYQAGISFNTTVSGLFFNGGTLLPGGPASTMTYTADPASTFYNTLANNNLQFGNTVEMNTTVPPLIKQTDFLKWIILMFNLYVEEDKANENNYIIEPRDQFIINNPSTALIWTKKQDLSQQIETLPMGALDGRSYTFVYTQDSDYFNAKYQDKWKEIYGQNLINVDNDFIKTDKKIELGFSPTPSASFQNDIVAPRFLSIDGGYPGSGSSATVKPLKCNIRILYWGGMKNCMLHLLRTSSGTIQPKTQYPSLNPVDDPINPTVDLGFNAPREIYWQMPAQAWITNNLYNRFYNKMITEITDPNSKIRRSYFLLTARDIQNFSFRNIVFVENAYYIINSITEYDPTKKQSVLVEMLKLKDGPAFLAAVYDPNNNPAGQYRSLQTTPEFNYQGNYGQTGNLVVGFGLNNGAAAGILTGNNTQVDRIIQGFDGIGVNGLIIGQQYEGQVMLRADAFRVSDGGIEKLKLSRDPEYTADFTVTKPVSYVNATAGNITVTLPTTTDEVECIIIRTDSSLNTVIVTGFLGTELILSTGISGTTDLLANTTKKTYSTDGHNWYY